MTILSVKDFLAIIYSCIALCIGYISRYIDFSKFVPLNLQSMIDGIWRTFLVLVIIIYETLRNYPDEEYVKQEELHKRKIEIVKRKRGTVLRRFEEVVEVVSAKYDASITLLLSIIICEDVNRPR